MRSEYDISKLKKAQPKYLKHLKESVTIRLDPQVLVYFKGLAEESGLPQKSRPMKRKKSKVSKNKKKMAQMRTKLPEIGSNKKGTVLKRLCVRGDLEGLEETSRVILPLFPS